MNNPALDIVSPIAPAWLRCMNAGAIFAQRQRD